MIITFSYNNDGSNTIFNEYRPDPDVAFEGSETIPSDVSGILNAGVTKIIGNVLPDSIYRSDTDPATQNKIQVRLTIRGWLNKNKLLNSVE